ncbi:MAG: glycosyltransferase family 2 protein [Candidatus Omnitrophica bacterium]|jgi:glycosyltransferase involved in cell wall biosynthesis|nr:glycosyltransferase family 2 protein [Candidatus Omnitrophota bacterium]
MEMSNLPKVSILIPVFNRENLIEETLNSAVNQTYASTEIIVVDNKSNDSTYNIVKQFASKYLNIKVYQNMENIGPVKNWRRCLDYSTGEYVKILWSDDLVSPTFIEKTLPYLLNYGNVGFVFTGTEIFNDNTGKITKDYFIGNTGIYDAKKFIEGSLLGGPFPVGGLFPVSPGNALFRKKDLEKNLLTDVPNRIGSDFSMHGIGSDCLVYLLTAKDYTKFAFINETLAFFRTHKDAITVFSDKLELTALYHAAKAYFVENYIEDAGLRGKFNAILLSLCLLLSSGIKISKVYNNPLFSLRLKNSNNLGIRKIQDFYFNTDKMKINYFFFVKLIFRYWKVFFINVINK